MERLELKVPPDVVWMLVAGLMWLASAMTPRLDLSFRLRVTAAVVLAVVGVYLMVSARVALGRVNTTWHPMTPGQATSLVTSGVFGLSRNPIYLGMLLVLFGWAVALSSPAALVLSVVFVPYLDLFQIGPEERALSAVLGEEFLDYRARVRRWI